MFCICWNCHCHWHHIMIFNSLQDFFFDDPHIFCISSKANQSNYAPIFVVVSSLVWPFVQTVYILCLCTNVYMCTLPKERPSSQRFATVIQQVATTPFHCKIFIFWPILMIRTPKYMYFGSSNQMKCFWKRFIHSLQKKYWISCNFFL